MHNCLVVCAAMAMREPVRSCRQLGQTLADRRDPSTRLAPQPSLTVGLMKQKHSGRTARMSAKKHSFLHSPLAPLIQRRRAGFCAACLQTGLPTFPDARSSAVDMMSTSKQRWAQEKHNFACKNECIKDCSTKEKPERRHAWKLLDVRIGYGDRSGCRRDVSQSGLQCCRRRRRRSGRNGRARRCGGACQGRHPDPVPGLRSQLVLTH